MGAFRPYAYSLLLSLFLIPLIIPAAPVPPPKARPTPQTDYSGTWTAHWSGAEWPTVMLPGGTYVAERPGGPRYEGRWSYKAGVLHIEERLCEGGLYGDVYKYDFRMRPHSPLCSICGGLRLEAQK